MSPPTVVGAGQQKPVFPQRVLPPRPAENPFKFEGEVSYSPFSDYRIFGEKGPNCVGFAIHR